MSDAADFRASRDQAPESGNDATPTGPRIFAITATPADAGQRVDRFLAAGRSRAAPAEPQNGGEDGLSRSKVKQLIEQGHLTRDGTAVREPSEPVRAGALYALALPAPRPALPMPQAIPLTILYEDRDLIVLDKQAGLVVHPAPGNEDGTLVNALLGLGAETLPGIGGERRPGIVHRLDRDTSGVMVVARTELALATLSAAFAARDIERHYLALVWGLPAPSRGSFEGAIGRDPRDRKRMAVLAGSAGRGGKPALTHYQVLRARETALALLACRLATGRTHQIRVHLSHAGHPVVGDPVYLRRGPAAAAGLPAGPRAAMLDFPRQALHAASLGFAHPRTGARLRFETAPPEDMRTLLQGAGFADPLAYAAGA